MSNMHGVDVRYVHVHRNEVWGPKDWPDHFYVPRRKKFEQDAALRVHKVGGKWVPFGKLPLRGEISYFLPDEPGQVVGFCKI